MSGSHQSPESSAEVDVCVEQYRDPTGRDSLKNMLPQNFDKSLLKLVNVEIN